MTTHKINICMHSRSSVLLGGNTEEAHAGVWFFDPQLYGRIEVGDIVEFMFQGEVIASDKVTEADFRPEQYPKFCSGVNSVGFKWE